MPVQILSRILVNASLCDLSIVDCKPEYFSWDRTIGTLELSYSYYNAQFACDDDEHESKKNKT